MHMASKMDFPQVTGVNPDAMGEKSEVRSGVGIQRKVAMTGLIVAPIFDNFKRTREALAKTIHDAVVVGYTPGKIMTITDNPESTRQVALDEQSLEAVKQAKYDIIVSEIEDLDTINEQQQEMIMRNLPAILQYGPGWGEVLFDMSSIRNKDEIKAKIAKIMEQNKTPNAPKMSLSVQMETLAPVERAFFYQQMGAPPEFIEQMMQQAPPPSQVLQAQAQLADNQMNMQTEVVRQQGQAQSEALKQQTESQKAQTAQVKAQVDVQKAGMDLQKSQADLDVQRQKSQLDLQTQAAKSTMEIQKARMMPDKGSSKDGSKRS
jgi:hypothetical protein